jgi:cob(I)alamin adenosyltransferase
MLRILLNYALGPQTRATLWLQSQRALRLLTCARHFQALAPSWLQAILQSACALYHFLQQACRTAERLAAKAVRKRRTTAQILGDSLQNHGETLVFVEAVSA